MKYPQITIMILCLFALFSHPTEACMDAKNIRLFPLGIHKQKVQALVLNKYRYDGSKVRWQGSSMIAKFSLQGQYTKQNSHQQTFTRIPDKDYHNSFLPYLKNAFSKVAQNYVLKQKPSLFACGHRKTCLVGKQTFQLLVSPQGSLNIRWQGQNEKTYTQKLYLLPSIQKAAKKHESEPSTIQWLQSFSFARIRRYPVKKGFLYAATLVRGGFRPTPKGFLTHQRKQLTNKVKMYCQTLQNCLLKDETLWHGFSFDILWMSK